MTATDVTCTLSQLGDVIWITDVITDAHEDNVLGEGSAVAGEQAAQSIETMRYGILKAGSNVVYANSVAGRTSVASVITRTDQRKVTRTLERQNASFITLILKSTPDFNTENVHAAFIAVCHVDLDTDIRGMTGFKDCVDYGTISPFESEVGSVEKVRYLTSTIFSPVINSGSASGAGTTFVSTAGAANDVYPVLYFAKDAYGLVALKGQFAITPMVMQANQPSKSDPLGQRGSIGWKSMQTAVILNDAFMVRYEAACTL